MPRFQPTAASSSSTSSGGSYISTRITRQKHAHLRFCKILSERQQKKPVSFAAQPPKFQPCRSIQKQAAGALNACACNFVLSCSSVLSTKARLKQRQPSCKSCKKGSSILPSCNAVHNAKHFVLPSQGRCSLWKSGRSERGLGDWRAGRMWNVGLHGLQDHVVSRGNPIVADGSVHLTGLLAKVRANRLKSWV